MRPSEDMSKQPTAQPAPTPPPPPPILRPGMLTPDTLLALGVLKENQ